MAINTISINDRLGDGGLESVAIFSEDASGNVTGLVGPGGQTEPLGVYIATVAISSDFTVPPNNAANKVVWDGGLIVNTTGSSSVWTAGDPTKLVVPTGFTKARVTSNLRLDDAFAGQTYINHIAKDTLLTYNGVGLETGERATAGSLNIQAQTSWVSVTAGQYFQTYVLNSSATTANTILGTVRSWFQIELMR